jgi:hypothetical protein
MLLLCQSVVGRRILYVAFRVDPLTCIVSTSIWSHVGVIYKAVSGLDDWIYCTLHIHTIQDYRQLERYR